MKLNEFKAALEGHAQLCDGIATLTTLQENAVARLAKLEAEADLEDMAALDKIARLRVQADLIPTRLSGLEEIQTASVYRLLTSTEEFVDQTLRPKIKALRVLAVAKAEKALASIYTGQKLTKAVNESDVVVSIDQISRSLQRDNEPSFPLEYAARRLAVLDQLLKIEKSL